MKMAKKNYNIIFKDRENLMIVLQKKDYQIDGFADQIENLGREGGIRYSFATKSTS